MQRRFLLTTALGALVLSTALSAQSLSLTLFRKMTTTYPQANGTIGCCYDRGAGLFHVAYFPTGSVYSFNIVGQLMNTFTTSGWPVVAPSPNGITWNPEDGNLWLVDNTSGPSVTSCDSTGKYVTGWKFTQPSTNPVGIAWNPDRGTLAMSTNGLVTEWSTQGVRQSGVGSTITYGSGVLSGVAFIPQTGHYIVSTGNDSLYEIDRTGSLISTTSLASQGLTNIQDVDYDPVSGFLTVVDNKDLTLYVFVYRPIGVQTYGLPCAGSGSFLPARRWSGSLSVGQSLTLTVERVLGPSGALYVFGDSNTMFGGTVPLPLDLAALGAPGCLFSVNPLLFTGIAVTGTGNGGGTGAITIPIPNDQGLVGATLYDQFMISDAAANGLGLITSVGGTWQLQK